MRIILLALFTVLLSINMNYPTDNKPTIIYVYDPMCGWCYGFSQVMQTLHQEKQNEYNFEIISGGMVIGENEGYLSKDFSDYILKAYKRVEELSGVKYGDAYLNKLRTYSLWSSSMMPSLALETIKKMKPTQSYAFASDLQYAYFYEGKDLRDSSNYSSILSKHQIDPIQFNQLMQSDEIKNATLKGFETSTNFGVTGYPCVLVRNSQGKYYKVANGYTDYNSLTSHIQKALQQ